MEIKGIHPGLDPGSKKRLIKIPAFAGMVSRGLALPLRFLIWVYQKTISPDHGLIREWFPYGYCKFYPSCSEYAAQILEHQGLTGVPKIIHRISKCRPGVSPAIDKP